MTTHLIPLLEGFASLSRTGLLEAPKTATRRPVNPPPEVSQADAGWTHGPAQARWMAADLEPVRFAHRRSEFGVKIARFWRAAERSGLIWRDPYAAQRAHVQLVQREIMDAGRSGGLWREPRDLSRFALPWYARLSIATVHVAEVAVVPALFLLLLAVI